MREKLKSIFPKAYCILSFSLFTYFIECLCYNFLFHSELKPFWSVIVVLVYIILIIIKNFSRQSIIAKISIEAIAVISTVFYFLNIKSSWMYDFFNAHIDLIIFVILLNCIISLILLKNSEENIKKTLAQNNKPKKLFNIFYLNTSKAHEIAMLIDNKIMKAIEQEQTFEQKIKQNNSISFGKKDNISIDSGLTFEDNYKNRVYESFDVKNTKSIMLRKIYDFITENSKHSLQVGNIKIFENVELQQVNVDDTVMVLNILQDSVIPNQGDENVKININKMMDKMLDDFTIDYTFEYCNDYGELKKYLIQLPYKTNYNFENGYQHNDLQLGKLSIIGIYRGNIDFSKRQSISSRFLDLFSESYNKNNAKPKTYESNEMKFSDGKKENEEITFEFHHQKLDENLHLVDVIAIIQEISFKEVI